MKIEVSATPYRLAELEALCSTARSLGFPDDAVVDRSKGDLIVRATPDGLTSSVTEIVIDR